MTNDPAALARSDQFDAELTDRIHTAQIAAGSIVAFYRCLKANDVSAALANALTHKFTDWYFGVVETDDDLQMHRCGRTLTHTDAACGLCQRCGDLLTQAELTAALAKGSTDDPLPHPR